ncbi:hypothetical protein AALP_AAs50850U000200 [Arabis alpina]|uniref:Uncharacterized protein n=1 Tax=Arabis alpina TaxID=50452 RepID=A0A087FZB1_ARAAL|nr:hypothetical protein AALP_AAs50850U000200 [Arabis alpina]
MGEGPGRIYALGLCIPGTEPLACSECIRSASEDLLLSCPNQTDSFNWRARKTLCFVRYSDSSFFDQSDLEPYQAEYNVKEYPGNITEYNRTMEAFMSRMIAAASSSTLGLPARRYYAADMTPSQDFVKIYALMQCIPGISSGTCNECLFGSVQRFQLCCGKYIGGSIRRPVCFFRFDQFRFLGAFENIISSPPPQIPQATPPPLGGLPSSTKKVDEDITSPQSLQFDFKTLDAATDKFSGKNKIGQGGFGEVYKGTFPNGTEIAVKRLSRNSVQGLREFKNEVVVVAKLQHRNLVRILGFYSVKQLQLDWTTRHNIIGGIARGMLYLHHDSRFTIIHRDLKASNILLDDDMKPKIADFGMARIFGIEQTRAETSKIAGTYGYMAPEYAMHGRFSVKSDVYSFGVLVLEIITGKKNSCFYQTDGFAGNLVMHVWRLWRKGLALEIMDPTFGENYQSDEVTRCIHIALLCVQEDPEVRPMMSTIILLLTSNTITLQVPRAPGFFFQSNRDRDPEAEGSNSLGKLVACSITDASITDLDPR